MGEATDSIRRDIDRERGQLEQNLEGIESKVRDTTGEMQHKVEDVQQQVQDKVEEVQAKVKNATDWRAQFDQRPMVGLAVAFGGGVLLASMMGGGDKGRDQRSRGYYNASYQPQYQAYGGNGGTGGTDVGRQHMASTFDNVKGAVMGVAAAQLKSILSDSLPGFDDEYKQVETEKRRNNGGSMSSNQSNSTSGQSNYPVTSASSDQSS